MRINQGLRAAATGGGGVTTDPNFRNTVLLLNGDGTNGAQNNTFIDSSTNNFTITRNGNVTQGSFSPYADRWSAFFDGTGDFLNTPNSAAFAFGTSNFTVEGWFYLTSSNSSQCLVDFRNTSVTTLGFFIGVVTSGYFQVWNGSNRIYVNAGITTNQWYHFAIARSGTTLKAFLNGTEIASVSDSTNWSDNACVVGRTINNGEWMIGYISNFRILKGTALYTSNFTPPTSPLTAITNTSLLACHANRFADGSTNNFTITSNGDTRVERFSPFAPSAEYSTSVIGGSAYFDGSGDFLRLPSSSAFSIATSTTPFTIECWIYPTAAGGCIFSEQYPGSGPVDIVIAMSGSAIDRTDGRTIRFGYYTGTAWVVAAASSTTVSLNTWTHVACVFTGSTTKIFLDGIDATASSPASTWGRTGSSGSEWYVGKRWDNQASPYFTGYISNLHFVNGTALYTSNFTPPTAPLTAVTNTSLLVNAVNGGIIDATAGNVLETVGNAQVSTVQKKYGTASVFLDGTGDYLQLPKSSITDFGVENFTVECWIYPTATKLGNIFSQRNNVGGSSVGQSLRCRADGFFDWFYTDTGTGAFTTTIGYTLNTWTHVALTREGNFFKVWVNGVIAGTSASISANINSLVGPRIGVSNFPLETFQGYIDDLRITKGVARYTANFTPPTAALPLL